MKKYICTICGFIYDESVGDPKGGIAPGTKWEELPDDWVCPLCGASKADFKEQKADGIQETRKVQAVEALEEMREMSYGELSALCSNLAKGCTKQYLPEEAEAFTELAEYFKSKVPMTEDQTIGDLISLIQKDLDVSYTNAFAVAKNEADRGALRALTWGEKATKILNGLMQRHQKQQDAMPGNTKVFVCEICGFMYIGDVPPDICPICKVPKFKILEISRGV